MDDADFSISAVDRNRERGTGAEPAVRGSPTGSRLRNILGNLGWLIGGKGFGAVCSLIYLAILARSLGLRDFGHFSLIFGTGQALVALAGFQTWQTVVRFGAAPLHAGDHRAFGRLAILCGVIDAMGAATGCLAAGLIYYGFADELGLNPRFVDTAFIFSCALLWARTTAASGVVRVLDRFDVAVYVEAIVPIGRLVAACAIAATGPSVGAFLAAWAAIELVSGAAYWYASRRLAPEAIRRENFGGFVATVRDNPGLLRFLGITYLSSGLDAVLKQGPLLAVGYLFSTSAAGLYRLADQVAQGLGKGATLLARALYGEIARARISISAQHFRRLIAQVTGMATLAGLAISLAAVFAGRPLLQMMGGDAFAAGSVILVPLAIGASLDLASIAYEPVLHFAGRAALSLVSRVCAIVAAVSAGSMLAAYGSEGIAWAVTAGYLAGFLVITSLTWRVLSHRDEEHGSPG